MATYDAAKVRAIAIELTEKITGLHAESRAIYNICKGWTLNGLDPALPGPYDVKIQIDAYKALVLDRLKLEPWASDLQKALVNDTLTYPAPPDQGLGIYFDETVVFDENLIF